MASNKVLRDMSIEDLEAHNQELMAERGKAEAAFKSQQQAVQQELSRRAVLGAEGSQALLAALPDDLRSQVIDSIGG